MFGQLQAIRQAIELLLPYSREMRLVALDKTILLGGPHIHQVPPNVQEKLESLHVLWEQDQESWGFYTGHG